MRNAIFSILILLLNTISISATEYIYRQGYGMQFGWDMTSKSSVRTVSSTHLKMNMQAVGADAHYAAFYIDGWGLSAGALFYAYYPYSGAYIMHGDPITALPVAYTSQVQNGNGNASHLSQYDFMTSQAWSSESALAFGFTHLGCILRVACAMDKERTFSSMTLTTDLKGADGKIFVAEGTMNITNNTLTPVTMTDAMTLQLNGVTVGEGEELVAYMMLAPHDYTGKRLTLRLTEADGTTTEIPLNGTQLLPGKCYPVALQYQWTPAPAASKAMTRQTEGNLPALPAAAIQFPTGYAPDFTLDAAHQLTEYVLLGDANGDGQVTVNDANLVVNYFLGTVSADAIHKGADVNHDGKLTIADANGIVNIFLNEQ